VTVWCTGWERNSFSTCAPDSHLLSDDTRCHINTIWPPEDEQDIA